MNTLMQRILALINKVIEKFSEKLQEEFPHILPGQIILIWFKLQEKKKQKMFDEETLAKLEKDTFMESILNVISQEIWKFAGRVHEKFSEVTVDEMLTMWCEHQKMWGFEFPDREKQHSFNDETVEKVLPKTCQHMFIKGHKANTQCKVKVKGDVEFCSKHKPKPKPKP